MPSKKYYWKNRERLLEEAKLRNKNEWRPRWPHISLEERQQRHAENVKAWRVRNRDKVRASAEKYHARKIQAMPYWVDKAMESQMRIAYRLAQRLTEQTGIPHHVDHIVPLQGKNVSGLHVPSNLQVITAEENLKKGNKWAH